jgi:Xaa-Pro aminopeptidase
MSFAEQLNQVQAAIRKAGIDGWLMYDFRRNNDLACRFLQIPDNQILTRRFFYWVPVIGDPIKIVSQIEAHVLEELPGHTLVYRTWEEMIAHVETVLSEAALIAMEYSPMNALPYVSKVDAGTMEMIRSYGVEPVSSADLLQQFMSVWDEDQLKSHLQAADILDTIAGNTWRFITECLEGGKPVSEYDVQQFIYAEMIRSDCVSADLPICAVAANSANPHYSPTRESSKSIHKGDFILIDLWCKRNIPRAVYADITRVAIASSEPNPKQQEIFSIVREAQQAATDFVGRRMKNEQPVYGWEVDQVCRDVITKAGYGHYFIHRTGHNIDQKDHGDGAHLDNLETHDTRQIMKGTCFSIEPGIYLTGEFGLRLEYDVYVYPDGAVQVTGGIQDSIEALF